MLRPSPTLARKDFGLNDALRLIAMMKLLLPPVSEERTFSQHKTFFAVSNIEQINARWCARRTFVTKGKLNLTFALDPRRRSAFLKLLGRRRDTQTHTFEWARRILIGNNII
jgi:hypothetical protein